VTTGSVMESSKVSLVKRIMAVHLPCSSKKVNTALRAALNTPPPKDEPKAKPRKKAKKKPGGQQLPPGSM